MKFYITILLLCFVTSGYSQFYYQEDTFFSVSVEGDVRNALFGSDVNPPAFDGVFGLAYRNQDFEFKFAYESFKVIEFQSFGLGGSYVVNYGNRFTYLIGGQLSLIYRHLGTWVKLHMPSAAINGQVEYNISRLAIYVRGEGRYRGDIKDYIPSGYLGLTYKFKL